MSNPKISIVIPAYNEAENIGDVVGKIRSLHPDAEIIVIDDGSQDRTAERAVQAGAMVYRHPYNIGNGAAVKSGIRVARGDILVFMDGDGQHDPEDVKRLLENLPEYDMVVGARSMAGQASISRALRQPGLQLACVLCRQIQDTGPDLRVQGRQSGHRPQFSISAAEHLFIPDDHHAGGPAKRKKPEIHPDPCTGP